MKAKVHASSKQASGSSLSELLRNGSSEEKSKVFNSVIASANESQRQLVARVRSKHCCPA